MSPVVKVMGIAAFVIVDVLLIAWLFTRDSAPDADGGLSTGEESGAAEGRPPVDESISLTRSESFTLFRVHPSDCSGDTIPKLEISTTAAERFREVGLPIDEDSELAIRSVLAVAADEDSPDDLTLLGADLDCKKKGYASEDGGESWERADVEFDWYVTADGQSVTSPDRTSSPDCVPIWLDSADEANAKVVCKSGSLRGTSDAGATWTVLGELDGMRAASFAGLRTGVAIAPRDDCKTQAFRSIDGGASWTPVACVDKEAEAEALVGGASQMIAGDASRTWISDDLGEEWNEVASPQ